MARESFGSYMGRQVAGALICLPSGYLALDAITQVTPAINPSWKLPLDLDLLGSIQHNTHMPPFAFALMTGLSFAVGATAFVIGSMVNGPRRNR